MLLKYWKLQFGRIRCLPFRHITGLTFFVAGILPLNAQLSMLSTQTDKKDTRIGNNQYQRDDYTDAEASYKKALVKKNNMPEATFNLGDAEYKQKRYDEAMKQFQLSAQTNADSKIKAKAYHNLGNAYLEQQKWEDAVKSYKESLKLNANDNDTKYNLAYANAMIQKQKNDQKNDKKQDKKDDKKDKKDQDKQNQKPDQPEQKKDNQQGKNDKQNQQQKLGEKAYLSKEEAEKLLQALANEEQKTNQKVQQKLMKPVNVKIQKDW